MAEIDRRTFITSLGGAVITLAGCAQIAPGAIAGTAARRKLSSIGIQLYTVRTSARADLPATLARLAAIGFREVEWWGTYTQTPRELRALLDGSGLTAPSVHIGIPRQPEGWAPIFDSASALGHKYITAASPPFQPRTPDDWKRLAAAFNEAGRRVKDAGFRFAYHNHSEGMRLVDDRRPFESLLAETDPELVAYELDIHWAYAGGSDAVSLISRYPNRFRMLHIKDSSGAPDFRQAGVGAGTYPWAQVLAAANRAGVEHYFVEHDSPPDAMAFAKQSFDYLSAVEF